MNRFFFIFKLNQGCVSKISFRDYSKICCDSEWFDCANGKIMEKYKSISGHQSAFTGLEQENGGYPPIWIRNKISYIKYIN